MYRSCKVFLGMVLCLTLALALLVLAPKAEAASVVASGDCGNAATWTLYDSGELRISGEGVVGGGYRAPWDYYDTDITSAVVEGGITRIGDYAFKGCSDLTAVTLPDSVTSIGEDAFYGCSSLTDVYLEDIAAWLSISFDDYDAFPLRANNLDKNLYLEGELITNLVIPERVITIGEFAFRGCSSLTAVMIPEGVTDIGRCAFYGCSSLTEVTISDGVIHIGEYAFEGCSSLTEVTIPASVTSIGEKAFYDCNRLTNVFLEDIAAWLSISFDGYCSNPLEENDLDKNIYLEGELITELEIPDGVTSIGDYAFRGCSSLTAVTIPDGVTSIGGFAFKGCRSLVEVTIPGSVTSIGKYAFRDCSSLTAVTIPGSVTSIGSYVFCDCSSLTEVTIPAGVSSIGGSAFSGCSSLTEVTIPAGVSSIGGSAFSGCSSLAEVTILDGVTSIGEYAFRDCSSLTEVTIPESVTSIWECVFYGCDRLEGILFLGDPPEFDSNAFRYLTIDVYYPNGNANWNDDVKQKYGGYPTYKEVGYLTAITATLDPDYFVGDTVQKEDLTVRKCYDSGWVSKVGGDQYSMSGCDTSTAGAKTVTVTHDGFSAEVTVYVHEGGVLEVDTQSYPESSHNYSNGMDETQVLTVPGATSIDLTFSGSTYVESGCDYIYIYDGADRLIGSYTGSDAAGQRVTVDGDTVKVRLTSDGTGNGYGYAFSDISAAWIEHPMVTEEGVEPTCTQPGRTSHKACQICPLVEGGEEIPAVGHSYEIRVVAPTCTEGGYTTHTCSGCGDSYRDGQVEATGHRWSKGVCTGCGLKPAGVEITKQPVSVKVYSGETAKVTVGAQGDGLTYTWYYANAGSTKYSKTGSFKGNSYSLSMTAARSGRKVYCVISDQYGNSVRTKTVSLKMKTALKILTQPTSVKVAEGKTAKVSFKVQGDGLSYKWYYAKKGSTKYAATDAFTSNYYSIKMNASRSGRKVYCIVTDAYGNSVRTKTVSLNMRTPLKITQQPASLKVANGKTAKVTVGVQGDGLTYKWYYADGSTFKTTSTFTSNYYSIKMNAARSGRRVYCVITDKYGNTVKTNTVTLSMK